MTDYRQTQGASRLLEGAAILGIAALLTKLLGMLQKIPLQNIGGDGVFGIYNTVYPFYTIVVTLATAGFPTAVSRFVAEHHAAGDELRKRVILRIASFTVAIFGVLGAALLYFGAPWIAMVIGSDQLVPALRMAAPGLLFIPLSAMLRGYTQGLQDMRPTAYSQVVEQAVRVSVMIVLLLYLTTIGSTEDMIAGGALFGSTAGGVAGLLVMLIYMKKFGAMRSIRLPGKEARGLLQRMLAYALPVCLATLTVPLLGLVDTFTLPRLLIQRSGMEEWAALVEIGIYNRGIPLVQLVTMLASSLSVLFIPSLTELKIKKDKDGVERQIMLALRWFGLIGLAASTGLAILAEPINIMLYEDATGTDTFVWIAWTAAPGAIVTVTAAMLQGLGLVRAPALHLIGAAVIKTVLNALLVPSLGITGAAIAGIAAYSLAALLNLVLLRRQGGLGSFNLSMLARSATSLLVMAGCALLVRLGATLLPDSRFASAIEAVLGVTIGVMVFALVVLRLRLLTVEELATLPKIGPRLIKLLRRWRWVS